MATGTTRQAFHGPPVPGLHEDWMFLPPFSRVSTCVAIDPERVHARNLFLYFLVSLQ